MRNEGIFTFGGECSRDHNMILTKAPPHIVAERDVETHSVAGRSGDLMHDNGRYKNVSLPYECAILPGKTQTLREAANDAVLILSSTPGYFRLENSFCPETFRMARISKQISIESVVEKAGKFTVNFDCKPQRFLISGEAPFEYLEPSFIVNPTRFAAKPLIVVYGTGPGVLTVGKTVVEIKELEDQVTLDCEVENAYRQVGEGAPENKNKTVYAIPFPELLPGENTVTWTGGITSVRITPRWWTL